VKTLAALAAACLTFTGSAALADEPGPRSRAEESCASSPPLVEAQLDGHRLVRLKASNLCRDRVVWVSWSLDEEVSESDFDILVVHPGVRFDWDEGELDRLSATIGLPIGADSYTAGTDVLPYCFDTDGAVFEVTTAGAGPGDSCPGA
jgi:hypothetical protein